MRRWPPYDPDAPDNLRVVGLILGSILGMVVTGPIAFTIAAPLLPASILLLPFGMGAGQFVAGRVETRLREPDR